MRFISFLTASCLYIFIVSTAIPEARKLGAENVVFGKDTGLLVLLVTLSPEYTDLKMLVPGRRNQPHKIHVICDIQHKLGVLFLWCLPALDATLPYVSIRRVKTLLRQKSSLIETLKR